jgi:hypothetical protein
MKLSKGTIRPGQVLQVLENGVVKASAPGLFNFADDPEKLPPIMPWFIGGNSYTFSQPKQYDEIWIMNFEDNPQQLYWFRKDKFVNCVNLLEGGDLPGPLADQGVPAPLTEENVEILCNRDMNGDWCTLYFSDGSGWVISKSDSIIQIRPNGTIQLNIGFDKRVIDITPKGISLGSPDVSAHSAAYGDVVAEIFNGFLALLKQIQMAAQPNPYTAAIATVLSANLPALEKKIPNVVSPHVTLE